MMVSPRETIEVNCKPILRDLSFINKIKPLNQPLKNKVTKLRKQGHIKPLKAKYVYMLEVVPSFWVMYFYTFSLFYKRLTKC